MMKSPIGIVVIVLVTLLSGAALGRGGGGHGGGGHGGGGHGGGHFGGGHGGGHFGGGHFGGGHGFGHAHFGGGHGFGHAHFGGGHHGGGRFAGFHSFSRGGFHGGRAFAVNHGQNFRNAGLGAGNVRHAFNSFSHAGALRSGRMLSSPAARAQIAAGAALAGWHGGHGGIGWWQHGNGGYGWVGPLFWPFAYYDIYDYTIWGDGIGFWDYGYPDIYAGIFGPYGYGDLAGYWPRRPYRRHAGPAPLERMCGDDSRDIAGLPIDQIAQAIEPNETQRAALDELGNASIQAAQSIRAACPTQIVLTAPGRLAAMQQRIEAMISAAGMVRPPLEKFYGLLNDEQKARLNGLAEEQRKTSAANNTGSLVQGCGPAQPVAPQWPTAEIEARLHPNDTQRAALEVLQDTSSRAADTLKAACQPNDAVTPPARLDAISKRLNTMLQAVKSVRAALDDFYATLSDEQKAQFEAIGPRRTS